MKTLIIAEKPDMGRTIAAVVEPKAVNRRSYLEGDKYVITWAIGHLVGLADPDHYDPRYKKWNANDLPIIPAEFKLLPNPKTKDQLQTIGELAKRCDRLVNACDAGREGQLIFHLIRRYLKLKLPTERLWISDLTPETIRKGFDNMRSDNDYEPLTKAASARSEADWLIGMNASRAFTVKHKTLLSVGRVQTPVLALLFDRHKEMTAFNAETYFTVKAAFDQNGFGYSGIWQGERITSKEKAEQLAAKVTDKQGIIVDYTITESKEYPYKLYDLTLLQREANGKYGMSAKKTLDIAQQLYEKHKVITYPRTNSNYVTEENIPIMGKVLTMLQGTGYGELANGADRGRVHKGNKAVCNPAKVEDHHAIMPTPKRASGLSKEEEQIYDLIVRRFLSQYYPPAVYNNHTVLTVVEEETFRTKAKEELDPGWKVVLKDVEPTSRKPSSKRKGKDEEAEDEELLTSEPFHINKDLSSHCVSCEAQEKATQPPKAYTEGTLLKAMESAGKSIEDDDLRDAMKDTGLGTPATRAATIERLKQVGYITLTGKKLEITAKGIAAIELIRGAGVELLASPEMTGRWEQRLHQISRGEASDEQFIEKVKQFATLVVNKVRVQQQASPSLFGEAAAVNGKGGAKGGKAAAGSTRGKLAESKRDSGGIADGRASTSRQPQASAGGSGGLSIIAACPRSGCEGFIVEGKRGFGCSAFRGGCKFVIWKEQQGKTISASMAKSLVEKGQTNPLTFKLEDGSSYKARLSLVNREDGTLSINKEG